MQSITDFFSGDFMPHGHCYLWNPELIWLHVGSDAIIVLAYYSIPIALTYIVYQSKGKMPFNWVLLLFAVFIMACGTTHLLEIVNIWNAKYILSGFVKAFTAVVSILTAIAILPILPKVIRILRDAQELKDE
jgi:two-component system NtrC family sensor kinase